MQINEFFLGAFLIWLPPLFWGTLLALSAFLYISKHNKSLVDPKWLSYKLLIVSAIVFRFIYVTLLSVGQYFTWSGNQFTRLLLNSPLSEVTPSNFLINTFPGLFKESGLGYFLFYSYGRFWINLLIVVGISLAFWIFLRVLRKYNERFFESGETELGFIAALIAGWPGFILFIPIAFLSVIAVSIIRGIFLKEPYTTLGYPLLLASAISLIWTPYLIEVLNLTVFRI